MAQEDPAYPELRPFDEEQLNEDILRHKRASTYYERRQMLVTIPQFVVSLLILVMNILKVLASTDDLFQPRTKAIMNAISMSLPFVLVFLQGATEHFDFGTKAAAFNCTHNTLERLRSIEQDGRAARVGRVDRAARATGIDVNYATINAAIISGCTYAVPDFIADEDRAARADEAILNEGTSLLPE